MYNFKLALIFNITYVYCKRINYVAILCSREISDRLSIWKSSSSDYQLVCRFYV